MTTVTYALKPAGGASALATDARQGELVASGDGAFLAYVTADIRGRLFDHDFVASSSSFAITTSPSSESDPHSTVLVNGNIVTAYAQYSVDTTNYSTFFRIMQPNGNALQSAIPVPANNRTQYEPAIAALKDGGFVVTWSRFYDSGNTDILQQTYDADGSTRGTFVYVESSSSTNSYAPSVAGLKNGGFVIAYSQQPNPGSDRDLFISLFANADAAGGGTLVAKTAIDTTGTSNDRPSVLALSDGGFAVAYASEGFLPRLPTTGSDIALQLFNADGSIRSGHIRVNAADLLNDDANTAGEQSNPHLSQLANGDLIVGWETALPTDQTNGNVALRAFDPAGHALTGVTSLAATSLGESDVTVADLGKGHFATAWSTTSDGIVSEVDGRAMELVRTSVGTKHGEKIKGDDLTDHMSGKAGQDKLLGGPGDDSLKGGKGDDKVNGGTGADILNGGKGADKLYAGKGDARDVFVFHKGDSGTGDGSVDRIFGFDRENGKETVHDVIDLRHLHVTLKDIDLDVHKHSVTLLVDYRGSGQPDMAIEITKMTDLNPGDLLL